ncbi:MAG: polyphenol oxidase family protein [Terrimicrobiaceae bacterium]|nr:polyphenol oxidase family protein [Terrimicrobiaceae bacterium]
MDLQLRAGPDAGSVLAELPSLFLGNRLLKAAFLGRVRGVDTRAPKDEAMRRLRGPHLLAARALGFGGMRWVEAEQIHGAGVGRVHGGETVPMAGVDALITDRPGVGLVMAVEDCAAVFLAYEAGRAVGLAHSGRKGTEADICGRTVARMREEFGIEPAELIAHVSPCIRPPHYEVDFAASIRRQLEGAGVGQVEDSGVCTFSHPELYYSYRRDQGMTGRMLALLAMTQPAKAAELER